MRPLLSLLAALVLSSSACGVHVVVDEAAGALAEELPEGCEVAPPGSVACAEGSPAMCDSDQVTGCDVVSVGPGPFPACCYP